MTDRTSRVQIEATTRGIDEAKAKLTGLANAQDGVSRASDTSSRTTESYQRRLDSIQRSLDVSFRNTQNLEKVERDLSRARDQGLISATRHNELLDLARDKYSGAERATSGYSDALKDMATKLALAASAYLGLSAIMKAGQDYTDLQNSLRVAGLEGEQLSKTFNNIYAAAQRQGAPVGALIDLYSKASQASGELGANSERLERFSEGVAVALRVAGTNSTQAAGALGQLGQALGSGTVRAEEFNSVNEGARPILQAVAAGMVEAAGSVSKLRQMVVDGEVSSKAFFNAFEAGRPILDEMAAKAVPTVAQGMTRLGNSFITLVGEADKVIGATGGIGRALDGISRWIDGVGVPSAIAFAGAFMNTLPQIGDAALAAGTILAAAFAPAVVVGGITLITGAVTGLGSALLALALANPFTAIAVAIAGLAATATVFRDDINRIFGVDVMQIVKDTANGLIGGFVGAFRAVSAAAGEIPGAFRAAFADAMNFSLQIVERGVNKILDTLKLIPGLDSRIGNVNLSGAMFDRGTGGNIVGAARDAFQSGQGDYVGAFGSAVTRTFSGATPAQTGRAAVTPIRAADFPVDGSGDSEGGSGGGRARQAQDAEKALREEIQRLNERTAAIRTATNVIGLDTFAREKALATQRLMSVATREGKTVTEEQTRQIDEAASAYARVQASTEQAREAQARYQDVLNTGRSAFSGFFTSFSQGIQQGKSVWESLANAAEQALNRILNKLLEMTANSAFDALFGRQGSGGAFGGLGGGLFGNLFGGSGVTSAPSAFASPLGGFGIFGNGGVFGQYGLTAFANGGIVNSPTVFPFANGVGLMGEAGPEAIMPLRRDSAGRLGVAAGGGGSNDNGPNIVINIQNNSKAQIEQTETETAGGKSIDIIISDVVAKEMARRGSDIRTTMAAQGGVREQRVRR